MTFQTKLEIYRGIDMEGHTYEKMFNEEKWFWWFKGRRSIIRSIINRFCGSSKEILEIGSGTGGNIEMLSTYGNYTGVEIDETAVKFAKSRHPDANISHANIFEFINQSNEQYDLVVILDVIEHIKEDKALLKKVKNILLPGGKVIISTPAHQWLWSYHDVIHHHHRRYSKKALNRLTQSSGWTQEYHTYFNCFLLPAAFASKIYNNRKKQAHPTSMPVWLNRLLLLVLKLESKIIKHMKLPLGVSHVLVLYDQG